mmetsp:Transcript_279/g.947  ORF Transcript_279/g.947 Transcript_279/m.947 type:complete len:218 (+) Transcript_279:1316-1969(+)
MLGCKPSNWGQYPIVRRAFESSCATLMYSLLPPPVERTLVSPALGANSPVIIRNVLVFPAPLIPSNPKHCPRGIPTVRFFTALFWEAPDPKALEMPCKTTPSRLSPAFFFCESSAPSRSGSKPFPFCRRKVSVFRNVYQTVVYDLGKPQGRTFRGHLLHANSLRGDVLVFVQKGFFVFLLAFPRREFFLRFRGKQPADIEAAQNRRNNPDLAFVHLH